MKHVAYFIDGPLDGQRRGIAENQLAGGEYHAMVCEPYTAPWEDPLRASAEIKVTRAVYKKLSGAVCPARNTQGVLWAPGVSEDTIHVLFFVGIA